MFIVEPPFNFDFCRKELDAIVFEKLGFQRYCCRSGACCHPVLYPLVCSTGRQYQLRYSPFPCDSCSYLTRFATFEHTLLEHVAIWTCLSLPLIAIFMALNDFAWGGYPRALGDSQGGGGVFLTEIVTWGTRPTGFEILILVRETPPYFGPEIAGP